MSTSVGDSLSEISAWWKAILAFEYSSTWSCGRRSLPKFLKKSRSAEMSFLRAVVVISRAAMLSSAAQARTMLTISFLVPRRGKVLLARVGRDQPRRHALERGPGPDHVDDFVFGTAHHDDATARHGFY